MQQRDLNLFKNNVQNLVLKYWNPEDIKYYKNKSKKTLGLKKVDLRKTELQNSIKDWDSWPHTGHKKAFENIGVKYYTLRQNVTRFEKMISNQNFIAESQETCTLQYIRNQKLLREAMKINHQATRRDTAELFRIMKWDSSSFKLVQRTNECEPEKLKNHFGQYFDPPYLKLSLMNYLKFLNT